MKPAFVDDISQLRALAPHDIIDVRSPGEFAVDHLPGAINLPVLSDAERAEVGTMYTQTSKFRARRLGAGYVAANIARHLQIELSNRPARYRPLIYCWRGGMRSNAMATVFSQVGWRATTLRGGYRTYRRHVRARLYDDDPPWRVVLVAGNTGAAKTSLLDRLAARGLQTVDLEDLAAHRGSVFGDLADRPQPSQKLFESRLLEALEPLDASQPIIVEAESSKIGERIIPPSFWRAMQAAPEIEIQAPIEARARHILDLYQSLVDDADRLEAILSSLQALHSNAQIAEWRASAQYGQFDVLVTSLLEQHYDPAYRRSRRRMARAQLGVINAPELDDAGLDIAADAVTKIVSAELTSEPAG